MMTLVMVKVIIRRLSDVQEVIVKSDNSGRRSGNCWPRTQPGLLESDSKVIHDLTWPHRKHYRLIHNQFNSKTMILTEVMLIISGVCQARTKFCKDSRSPSCSALMSKQSRFSAAVWQGSTRWWWWCWWWWWWSRSPTSLQWSSKGQSGHPGTRFVGIVNAMDAIISRLSSSAFRWK